jgi:hypothetical protein
MPHADLAAFDALCDERFDAWVEELRDFCSIPCETDRFLELDRGAEWVEQRLRQAGPRSPCSARRGSRHWWWVRWGPGRAP